MYLLRDRAQGQVTPEGLTSGKICSQEVDGL